MSIVTDSFRDALTLAGQLGSRHLEAHSYRGLAASYYATGDLDQARRHWGRGLARYPGLGIPEAGQVRARLDALNAAAP